jgi:RimJ/RimL family protein N-acetyltransferase
VNVSLRPCEDRDLEPLFRQMADAEAVRMAAFVSWQPGDREAAFERIARLRADTSVTFLVIDVDGEAAGTIGSFRIDDKPEVTYWVDRAFWGRGVATAALALMVGEIAERPLYASAASDNVGSLRVLEKVGFRPIGVDRGFAPARGEEIEETLMRLD